MPEHVHMIVHPKEMDYDIELIRKKIKSPVAKQAIAFMKQYSPEWITKISRIRGLKTEKLFWQSGGGYDRNIIKSETLLKMIDYIHMNPVRRKLVEHPADWKWSSAGWFIHQKKSPVEINPMDSDWLSSAF